MYLKITIKIYKTAQNIQYGARFFAGPSPRPPFVKRLFFAPQMNLNKKTIVSKGTVAWFLVSRSAKFWVFSYYILWARRGHAKVGESGFFENLFVYGYSNYMVKFKFIFYPYKKPKWVNSRHKERRVIKLSVKYKLLLADFIHWPKFTP